MYTITLVRPGETVFVTFLVQRIEIFYGITLAMNFICTCAFCRQLYPPPISLFSKLAALIAYKIWTIQKPVAPFFKGGENDLSRLAAIVVESGESGRSLIVFEYNNVMPLNRCRLLCGSLGNDNHLLPKFCGHVCTPQSRESRLLHVQR